MSRFHIVTIAKTRYHRQSGAPSLESAAMAALALSKKTWRSVVIRDGATGKRYTIADARRLLGLDVWGREISR